MCRTGKQVCKQGCVSKSDVIISKDMEKHYLIGPYAVFCAAHLTYGCTLCLLLHRSRHTLCNSSCERPNKNGLCARFLMNHLTKRVNTVFAKE